MSVKKKLEINVLLVNTTLDVEMNRIKSSLLLTFLSNLCGNKFISNKNISWWKCLLSLHKKFFLQLQYHQCHFLQCYQLVLYLWLKCENQFCGCDFPCKSSSHFFWKKKITPQVKSNRKRALATPFFVWRFCYVLALLYQTTTKAGAYGVVN